MSIFTKNTTFGFAERIAFDVDFKTFAFLALLADGAKVHRSETPPPSQNQGFTLIFGTLLDHFVVNALGISRNIRARLMECALFEDDIVVMRRHLCG